jgi:hypothetical protein
LGVARRSVSDEDISSPPPPRAPTARDPPRKGEGKFSRSRGVPFMFPVPAQWGEESKSMPLEKLHGALVLLRGGAVACSFSPRAGRRHRRPSAAVIKQERDAEHRYDEGALPLYSELRVRPLIRSLRSRPLPAQRGEVN